MSTAPVIVDSRQHRLALCLLRGNAEPVMLMNLNPSFIETDVAKQ